MLHIQNMLSSSVRIDKISLLIGNGGQQQRFEENIMNLVLKFMLPFWIVEDPLSEKYSMVSISIVYSFHEVELHISRYVSYCYIIFLFVSGYYMKVTKLVEKIIISLTLKIKFIIFSRISRYKFSTAWLLNLRKTNITKTRGKIFNIFACLIFPPPVPQILN